MPKVNLLVISGPSSGVGKDTIVRMFLKKHPKWHQPASVTTRLPREGEVPGEDYIFTDRASFKKMAANGDFLEWEETAGNFYGTPKESIDKLLAEGHDIIMRKDVRGALSIKKALPHTTTVCLIPEDWESMEQRLRARGTDSEEVIKARLELAKQELAYKQDFDYVILNPNNRPEEALAAVEKVAGLRV